MEKQRVETDGAEFRRNGALVRYERVIAFREVEEGVYADVVEERFIVSRYGIEKQESSNLLQDVAHLIYAPVGNNKLGDTECRDLHQKNWRLWREFGEVPA